MSMIWISDLSDNSLEKAGVDETRAENQKAIAVNRREYGGPYSGFLA